VEQAGPGALKRAVAERYRLWVGLAIALDVVFVFGPPVLPPSAWGWSVMLGRWLVMMIGACSLIWAHREERIESSRRHWLTTYLVFGFTGAATLNLLGVLRL
jgi:hypothetical protein